MSRQKKGRRGWLSPRCANAFTLPEVLVSIAVILVIVTLLFVVGSVVKKRAMRVGCASNLRQIYVAAAAYASDNNGMMPPYHTMGLAVDDPTAKRCVPNVEALRDAWLLYAKSTDVFYCPMDPYARQTGPIPGEIRKKSSEFMSYELQPSALQVAIDGTVSGSFDMPAHPEAGMMKDLALIINLADIGRFEAGGPSSIKPTAHGAYVHILWFDGAVTYEDRFKPPLSRTVMP